MASVGGGLTSSLKASTMNLEQKPAETPRQSVETSENIPIPLSSCGKVRTHPRVRTFLHLGCMQARGDMVQ